MIGQPEAYADVLKRVFWSTLFVGTVCTAILAYASPTFGTLLGRVPIEAELGPVKGLKLLYVFVPAVIALISRMIKLHDRISDLLRLRFIIETRHILLPLAEGSGVDMDDARRIWIELNRRDAMYNVFYPYVSLPEAKIDRQLVRSALDNYGWFWVLLEASALVILTTLGLLLLGATLLAVGMLFLFAMLILALWAQWRGCIAGTRAEVRAILATPEHKEEIRRYIEQAI